MSIQQQRMGERRILHCWHRRSSHIRIAEFTSTTAGHSALCNRQRHAQPTGLGSCQVSSRLERTVSGQIQYGSILERQDSPTEKWIEEWPDTQQPAGHHRQRMAKPAWRNPETVATLLVLSRWTVGRRWSHSQRRASANTQEYAGRRDTTSTRRAPGYREMQATSEIMCILERYKQRYRRSSEEVRNLSGAPAIQHDRNVDATRIADESMADTRNWFISLRQQRVLDSSGLLLKVPIHPQNADTMYESRSRDRNSGHILRARKPRESRQR